MPDIPLDGFIDKARVDWVMSQAKKGDRVVINSGGGSLAEADRLADFIRNNGIDTHVFSTGQAHSAAALVFASGNRRTAGKNAQFMIHPATEQGALQPAGIAYLQNRLVNFGVPGTPDFIKAEKGDWVIDYDGAKGINLVNAQDMTADTIFGPLE